MTTVRPRQQEQEEQEQRKKTTINLCSYPHSFFSSCAVDHSGTLFSLRPTLTQQYSPVVASRWGQILIKTLTNVGVVDKRLNVRWKRTTRTTMRNNAKQRETTIHHDRNKKGVGTSRHKSNDMSSTTSGVRDVAQPTIGPYMPIEGDAIQHASSTHLHGPQDQRPTDRNIGGPREP